MKPPCPHCSTTSAASEIRGATVKIGRFKRGSDCKLIQRYRCTRCCRSFSNATLNLRCWQKKRQKNHLLRDLACSGVSQRRAALILNLNRKTVAARLRSLAMEARVRDELRSERNSLATHVQFDDLETFEHTKLKPLSVTLAVEHPTRRILGFEVSRMPAKGALARPSVKKYGPRKDERGAGRTLLFSRLTQVVSTVALIESDQNPHYAPAVREFLPDAHYAQHKGQRGSVVGQGELKKIRFDPLFSLNHTCAMKRYGVSRLIRRTWNTTKVPERLADHLAIYVEYHNSELIT